MSFTMNFKTKILPILALSIIFGQPPTDSTVWNESLIVKSYTGPNSILLVWDSPEKQNIESGRILRSDNLSGPFNLIGMFSKENDNRFLDSSLVQDHRYFYRIELLTESGNWVSSDRETPLFEKVQNFEQKMKFSEDRSTAIKAPIDFIRNEIYENLPTNLSNDVKSGLSKLLSGEQEKMPHEFLEENWLQEFENISSYIFSKSDTSISNTVFRQNDSTGTIYCNTARLTPEEWNMEIEENLQTLNKRLEKLKNSLNDAYYMLEGMPSVAISNISNRSDSILVEYIVLKKADAGFNEINFNFEGEFYSIPFDAQDMKTGIPYQFTIETESPSIILLLDDQVVNDYVIPLENTTAQYTLTGDILLHRSRDLYPVIYSSDKTGLMLNEIVWNNNSLGIELYGKMDFEDKYGIYFQDSLLWVIETFYPQVDSYNDSTFILHELSDSSFYILDLKRLNENDSLELLESFFLTDSLILVSRLPDGKNWEESFNISLGESNFKQYKNEQTIAVPELFALYQNYPNPFNGQTRISFDLLEESIVNLYVSDALGHIVDRFIIGEQMNKGAYHFTWDGINHSSGIYFFTLSAEVSGYQPVIFSRKMIYMK